jgi:fumarylacetoacetase
VSDPNDPTLRSFIDVGPTSDFPIQNLPYGVFSAKDGLAPRVGVAIGDYVLDLWELEQDSRLDVGELGVFAGPTLNPFMALGPKVWSKTRARISELLRHDHPELRDNDELRVHRGGQRDKGAAAERATKAAGCGSAELWALQAARF